ncbi:MAG: GNAT family N-acetyltransferase [Pseudobacteriovorax sp.]|nr:GNAT family N-acetyltransferase [Pseudobacteriovorax sp.]
MLRNPIETEKSLLIDLAYSTGVWQDGEADALLGAVLDQYYARELEPEHRVVVLPDANDKIVGWSYYAPSFHAPGVWDVWWIGVHATEHGRGYGRQLLLAIEADIKAKQGRVVVIETSSTEPLAKARRFYPKLGYKMRGDIPEFYGPGDAKVIFSKNLE